MVISGFLSVDIQNSMKQGLFPGQFYLHITFKIPHTTLHNKVKCEKSIVVDLKRQIWGVW